MRERREIVSLWRSRNTTSQHSDAMTRDMDAPGVLVTLVRRTGSSYRGPGARMLVFPDAHAGTISGGCLEGEILRRAAWTARSGAVVKNYSTYYDEVDEMPYGLGCGGAVDLLFEPLSSPETQALMQALDRSLGGERLLAATLWPAPDTPMQRVVLHPDGALVFASGSLDAESRCHLASAARQLSAEGHASAASLLMQRNGAEQMVFVETLLPPQRIFLFGAGDDSRPLAHLAHLLGWRVVVADGRPDLARAERFPGAETVLHLPQTRPRQADMLATLRLTREDAAVLLTHSYEQDRALLPQLLPLGLRYLGLMGARHRSRLLLQESALELGWTPEQCLERVHAPVGLDLGGDQPEEIALAIVAELQSVLHSRGDITRPRKDLSLLSGQGLPFVPAACPQGAPAADNAPRDPLRKDAGQNG
jgi:xanthine/CO dehydrogenase XdhC/CoxF family maturation factor